MCFLPGLRVVISLPDTGWGWRGATLWLLAYPGAGVLTGGPCELLGNELLGNASLGPSTSLPQLLAAPHRAQNTLGLPQGQGQGRLSSPHS